MGVERNLEVNKSPASNIYRPPALRRSGENTATAPATPKSYSNTDCISAGEANHCESGSPGAANNCIDVKSQRHVRRERRPDRVVYVPRARRSQTTPPQVSTQQPESLNTSLPAAPVSTPVAVAEKPARRSRDSNNREKLKTIVVGDAALSNQHHQHQIENSTNISNNFVNMSNLINDRPGLRQRIEDASNLNNAKIDKDVEELQRASKEINRSNRRIIKQTFNSDVLEIPDVASLSITPKFELLNVTKEKEAEKKEVVDPETDDWDSMYDDNGECLDPKIIEELTASVGKVKIETPKMDYSAYHIKQSILNEEEYPHVLEVSSFPVEFKTPDLMMLFSSYKESGFDIKWVDDTHALAVFSSSRIAAEVLTMGHPFVKLKPLAEATLESRVKAKKCAASMQPYRARPETCVALARRLVTGALGVRLKTAAAEREIEKRVLQQAKERKLMAAKQRDEAWES